MNLLSSTILRAAAVAVALPFLGVSASVQLNGVCVNGSCTPTPLTYGIGNSQSGSTSNGIMLGSDPYSINTSFALGIYADGTNYIDFYPTAVYVGSSPASTTDTITVDLLASIYDPGIGNWNGTYTEHVPLVVAQNSVASGQLLVDGQGIGQVGPYGPGSYDIYESATLTGINGATLSYSFDYTYIFFAGTLPGATDSSPAIPEPATIIPAALALAGFGLLGLRRRKR